MSADSNRLAQRLGDGQSLLGLYLGYSAEGILEAIGSGWDFVWIDGQHGQFSIDGALRVVRVASLLGLETVLRVPTHDAGLLAQYADTAASALMVPQVDSAEMAECLVQALRFPPRGNRSFGGRRTVDAHGRDYYRTREPLVLAQIESRRGLEQAERIITVDGIDGLFFGPDDLKLSFGLPIDKPLGECGEIIEARRKIAHAARAVGKWSGCPAVAPAEMPAMVELGYQLLIGGGDVPFLRNGARQALTDCRRALEQIGKSNPDPNRKPAAPRNLSTY